MMRRLWLAACVLLSLLGLSVPLLAIVAIWNDSGRLGGVAGVLGVTFVVSGAAFGIWTDESKPEPLLPRKQRVALRREQDRIALERRVADMEREAGIR